MNGTSSHVTDQLSDYCLGQLAQEDASRVAEHLMACRECRQAYDDIKLGVQLAKQLKVEEAPDALWHGVMAGRVGTPSLSRMRVVDRAVRRSRIAASIALLIAGGAMSTWTVASMRAARWSVASLSGAPSLGSDVVRGETRMEAGDWLVTDSVSRARVTVGRIGDAEVAPGSKLRLLRANPTDHRLALERGSIHARISAPPRLFVVETPAATAIDLGCEYTLDVDASGASRLHVTLGWVALTDRSRQTLVPAGAIATTRPGVGVSIPYYEDASPALRNAVLTLDERPDDAIALGILMNEARRRDALTLWHVIPRVEGDARDRLVTKLASLVAMPANVSRDDVMRLEDRDLDRWLEAIEPAWIVVRQPVWMRVVSGVWEYVRST